MVWHGFDALKLKGSKYKIGSYEFYHRKEARKKMGARIKWIDRKFSFDFPADCFPEIMERLRGTPARVEDLIKDIAEETLKRRPENSWSIQEHVGHLISVEILVSGRLDDYEAEKKELRAADMKNRKTEAADYNSMLLELILTELRKVRGNTMDRLAQYNPEMFARSSFHPRLKVPMRLVDCMAFFAEHDDFHLARIFELKTRNDMV